MEDLGEATASNFWATLAAQRGSWHDAARGSQELVCGTSGTTASAGTQHTLFTAKERQGLAAAHAHSRSQHEFAADTPSSTRRHSMQTQQQLTAAALQLAAVIACRKQQGGGAAGENRTGALLG